MTQKDEDENGAEVSVPKTFVVPVSVKFLSLHDHSSGIDFDGINFAG